MDPDLVNIGSLNQDTRYKILTYLLKERKLTSRQLGYSPNYINRVKRKVLPVSDGLIKACLRHLSLAEFRKLTGEAVEELRPSEVIRVLKVAMRDPNLKALVIDLVLREAREEIREASKEYRITDADLEKFSKVLATKSYATRRDHWTYFRKAVEALNYTLTPESINDLLLDLRTESPHVARHVSKALKLFIKSVIMPKDLWLGQLLYNSFKTVKCEYSDREFPSLEEVRKVAKAIRWIPAKAYFALLAETGLRPGEVLALRISDVDFDKRTVRPRRVTDTKRAYISFFSPRLRDFLVSEYLPYRDRFVKEYGPRLGNLIDASDWSLKLFPFKPSHLRAEIYKAMDEALGRRFRIYDLRGFFFSYMTAKGVSPYVVNLLQGRVPPKEYRLAQMHYLAIGEKELKEIYDKAGLSVLA